MSEVSSAFVEQKSYASGGIEFQNQMRAFDLYHKEMQTKINMYTRKMDAKGKNTEKFREVREKELARELDELEDGLARAKIDNQRKLKQLNEKGKNNDKRDLIFSRKELENGKLQFMRDLQQFDPRWKDKLRAK